MARAKTEEKPTLLGARVYRKHRKMLAALEKKIGVKRAEVLRRAIEEKYERTIASSKP